jgi:hypothetical protein
MKKLILVSAVLAFVLAMPATASAHKLRKGFAVGQARAAASEFAAEHFFFTEEDIVSAPTNYTSRGFCTRASKHKVFCAVGWIYEDAFSEHAADCVGETRSKLRRNSNLVVTRLQGVECEQFARADGRARLNARMGE